MASQAMTDDRIGKQVARVRKSDDRVLTLYHAVETIVNEQPIVRCGRRFAPTLGTRLEYTNFVSVLREDDDCKVCYPSLSMPEH